MKAQLVPSKGASKLSLWFYLIAAFILFLSVEITVFWYVMPCSVVDS